MSNATARHLTTLCSGCMEPVIIDRNLALIIMPVPSNGKRGSLHVPAHNAEADIINDDGDLITWDCPRCDEADSFDLHFSL